MIDFSVLISMVCYFATGFPCTTYSVHGTYWLNIVVSIIMLFYLCNSKSLMESLMLLYRLNWRGYALFVRE